MKDFSSSIKEISKKEKGLFFGMIGLVVLAVVLFGISMLKMPWGTPVTKVGYGDIGRYQGGEWSSMANAGGYHDGKSWEMLAFPMLAVVFGILHNLLVVKLYQTKGDGIAKIMMYVSICLVLATFLVLFRLSGGR